MINNKDNSNQMGALQKLDKDLRQMIAEYYMAVQEINDPARAVGMLAEHVAIMVEMINELKGNQT